MLAKLNILGFHKRRTVDQVRLRIINNIIETVNQICFLGIVIDKRITWQKYVDIV